MDAVANSNLSGLRILGFCDHFTDSMTGGAEIVTREVYRRLQSEGAEVRVLSVIPGGATDLSEVDGIPTRMVAGRDLSGLLNAQVILSGRFAKVARAAVDEFKPDVLHASSIHFRSSAGAAGIARSGDIPLVTTAHIGDLSALPPVTRLATRAYERTIGQRMLRASDRVIAVSQNVADHVGQLGVPGDRLTVVSNGVDHDRFGPQPAKKKHGQVVFVGRLIGNKGPLDALRAFARVTGVTAELVFAGDGPLRRKLQREADRLGVGQRVIFLGQVRDVADAIRGAEVLIRPSLTEGQSLTLLEAMAAGVCVVASDIPANSELVEHGTTGLLARPGDIADLAAKLALALRDTSLCQRLSEAAHQHSLGFSWQRCATETGAVLVAAAHPTGSLK